MFYAVLGYAHAALWRLNLAVTRRVKAIHALAGERGQGTVEYVGLILLVSLLMVGMVAAMKGFNGKQGTELADVIIDRNLAKGHVVCQACRKLRNRFLDTAG
jgi:hypothetical protein